VTCSHQATESIATLPTLFYIMRRLEFLTKVIMV